MNSNHGIITLESLDSASKGLFAKMMQMYLQTASCPSFSPPSRKTSTVCLFES